MGDIDTNLHPIEARTQSKVRNHDRYRWVFCAAAIAMTAGIVRFIFISRESIWADEALSIAVADLNLSGLWHYISTYPNMALYYGLLHLWVYLGHDEATVRSLSAITGVAAVAALSILAKRLFGGRVAIVASFLFATNIFHVKYSQEARSYSLVVLLVVLSYFFFARAIERDSRSDWTWHIITSTLALYSHFFVFLVLIAQWVSLFAVDARRVPWRRFLSSATLIGLLSLPLGLGLLIHRERSAAILANMAQMAGTGAGARADWLSATGLYNVFSLFSNLAAGHFGLPARPSLHNLLSLLTTFGGPLLLTLAYGIGCVGGVWIVVRAIRRRNSPFDAWHCGLLLSGLFTPILITWAVSLRQSIFVNKYLIICLPSLVLLVAIGISRIKPRWLFAAASMLVVVLLAWNLNRFYTTPENDDWRDATSDFVQRAVPTDGMAFFNPIGQFPFEYYARRVMPAGITGSLVSPKRFDGMTSDTVESYTGLSARYPRLWLFEGNVLASAEMECRLIEKILASHYLTVSHTAFRGVTVLMYSNEGQHASYGKP